jgi:hypothetical protein
MRISPLYRLIVGFSLLTAVFAAQAPDAGTALAQQLSDKAAKINYAELGNALMKERVGDLSLGIDDNAVLKKLGEPDKKSAAQIWGADGMEHQRWHYQSKGIELGMIRNGSKQVVDRISLEIPCDFKTQRGIQIGSKVAEVQLAYKNELNPSSSRPESTIVAGTIYGGIIFGIKDGVVNSIFIGAAAE